MNVLVTAASRHGSTREIAEAIGQELAARDIRVVVLEPAEVRDIREYDAVVLGSAVYAGRWLEPATALVARSGAAFDGRPVWLFSSGPVGDPSRKLVQKMGADPVDLPAIERATRSRSHRTFAGRLERRRLSIPQRIALTIVRGFEGDFRDWPAIRLWASEIADALKQDGQGSPL
jgi:menaquinone-dependent protoporphyrinogen oxidase